MKWPLFYFLKNKVVLRLKERYRRVLNCLVQKVSENRNVES